jgi:hypothetical protein
MTYFAVQVHYLNGLKDRLAWEDVLTSTNSDLAANYAKRHNGEGLGVLRVVRLEGKWPHANHPNNPASCVHFIHEVEASAWAKRLENQRFIYP